MTQNWQTLVLNSRSDATSFTYATICSFGIFCGWMKKIGFLIRLLGPIVLDNLTVPSPRFLHWVLLQVSAILVS